MSTKNSIQSAVIVNSNLLSANGDVDIKDLDAEMPSTISLVYRKSAKVTKSYVLAPQNWVGDKKDSFLAFDVEAAIVKRFLLSKVVSAEELT